MAILKKCILKKKPLCELPAFNALHIIFRTSTLSAVEPVDYQCLKEYIDFFNGVNMVDQAMLDHTGIR